MVSRDCLDLESASLTTVPTNLERVTKFSRQGEFDNIHVAPKMVVKAKLALVRGPRSLVKKFTSLADWKMDEVTMAPFCAHDCFHMHWRWTDNANTERGSFGWGQKTPYELVGSTMVPWNQTVGILLQSGRTFLYLARADDAPKNEWLPFCHHGAGYALSVLTPAKLAKLTMTKLDRLTFLSVGREPGEFLPFKVNHDDWALFYWRLRYTFEVVEKQTPNGKEESLELVERFTFKDKIATLKL